MILRTFRGRNDLLTALQKLSKNFSVLNNSKAWPFATETTNLPSHKYSYKYCFNYTEETDIIWTGGTYYLMFVTFSSSCYLFLYKINRDST